MLHMFTERLSGTDWEMAILWGLISDSEVRVSRKKGKQNADGTKSEAAGWGFRMSINLHTVSRLKRQMS